MARNKKRLVKKPTKTNPRTNGSPGARGTPRASAQSSGAARAVQLDPAEALGTILESLAPALFETLPDPVEPQELVSGTFATVAEMTGGKADLSDIEPVTPRICDQRETPRVALAIEIGLISDSHFFSGLSGDVSEGGVFVQTYRELPVGREVALDFELPGGHVTANGRVCWHRSPSESAPPGVGIAFDHLPAAARAIIHDFCEAREPLYYDLDRV